MAPARAVSVGLVERPYILYGKAQVSILSSNVARVTKWLLHTDGREHFGLKCSWEGALSSNPLTAVDVLSIGHTSVTTIRRRDVQALAGSTSGEQVRVGYGQHRTHSNLVGADRAERCCSRAPEQRGWIQLDQA